MMSKKVQLILFGLMTIFGCVVSLNFLWWGGIWVFRSTPEVLAEIRRNDGPALTERAKQIIPGAVIGSVIVLGTFYSYRRYDRLALTK